MKTFFFLENTCACVLGLEHSCPWPREVLSSKRLSLALASDFFCVLGLGLEPCVLDSTSAFLVKFRFECPVLSSAIRAQNKHKKYWKAQAKLFDVLSDNTLQKAKK